MEARSTSVHVEVHAPICAAAAEILTPDSLRFVGYLCHKFEDRRQALLNARVSRALEFDSGALPHFEGTGKSDGTMRVPHSHATEDPHWQCAPIPDEVKDRRVEITGLVKCLLELYRLLLIFLLTNVCRLFTYLAPLIAKWLSMDSTRELTSTWLILKVCYLFLLDCSPTSDS